MYPDRKRNHLGSAHYAHRQNRWAIILAGGDGKRMQPFIKSWLGEERPKQHCCFTGDKSMLQYTLDRAKQCVPEENIVLIVNKNHHHYLEREGLSLFKGFIIEETNKRGTACGVFFAVSHILEMDKNADVIVFPADHFIHPTDLFIQKVHNVFNLVQHSSERVFLLGAEPTSLELDYGWIMPRSKFYLSFLDFEEEPHESYFVESFFEKPGRYYAEALYCSGGLWNTMISVFKAQHLWDLGQYWLDEWINELRSTYGGNKIQYWRNNERTQIVDMQFDNTSMQPCDFSSDFLTRIAKQCSVVPMRDILWSDWGRPERLIHSIKETGLKPAFPMESMKFLSKVEKPFIKYTDIPLIRAN